jgi:hypothetical protein
MSDLKTQKTEASVEAFLQGFTSQQQEDYQAIVALMREVTGDEPALWGTSIIGFGSYHYKYASGREGDWFQVGFAPRKQNLTFYLGYQAIGNEALREKLGKHTVGKGCLYIKRLSDVDTDVLRQLIVLSVESLTENTTETS